jgi:hypothetical protein
VFKGRQLAEIELPKKVIVPRHEQEPPPDPERDVMVAAAVQLEQHAANAMISDNKSSR